MGGISGSRCHVRPWLQPTSECLQQPDLLVSISLLKIDYGVSPLLNYLSLDAADLAEIRCGEITFCLYIKRIAWWYSRYKMCM